MTIDIRTLQETNEDHYFRLAEILKASWGHLDGLTFLDFESRAERGSKTFVAHDSQPVGIIQTIGIRQLELLRTLDYSLLAMLREPQDPRYRLCLDVTIAKEALKQGLGRNLINYAIFQTACFEPSIERILTYTPKGMESWHIKKNGAVLTDIPTIARARPGHNPEDVVILDYTARLTEYRRDLSNLAPLISAGKIPISLK